MGGEEEETVVTAAMTSMRCGLRGCSASRQRRGRGRGVGAVTRAGAGSGARAHRAAPRAWASAAGPGQGRARRGSCRARGARVLGATCIARAGRAEAGARAYLARPRAAVRA
jgi:hypothetical protein